MRIVEAVWEQRNLGVSCYEITCERDDSVEELVHVLNSYKAQYMVLKIPSGMVAHIMAAQAHNYTFIEALAHVTHDLKSFTPVGIQKRLLESVSYAPMDAADVDFMRHQLEEGIFATDRVALDPAFSLQLANRRYIGWLEDEVARGAELFKLVCAKKSIGFFASYMNKKDLCAIVGGMYKGVSGSLGSSMVYSLILEAVNKNASRISSHVSLNNPSAIRLHSAFGFFFSETQYVFVDHKKAEPC